MSAPTMPCQFGNRQIMAHITPDLSARQAEAFDTVFSAIMSCYLDDPTLEYCREKAVARVKELYPEAKS